jgi:N-acetylneuraminic acid mutarotase
MKSTRNPIAFILITVFLSTQLISQNFTWMHGAAVSHIAGTYGTVGVPSPLNDPGGRHGCATWVDASGNLWLLGGEGYAATTTLCWMNDLWKYDISTNEWTWMSGPNTANQPSVYGTMGVPSSTAHPGAREFAMSWTDAAGNFWLFGGDGFDGTNTFGKLADLWKYNPTTNQWTWMKGFNTVDHNGVYGTMGVPTASNAPGGRYGGATWYDNATGNLWLFGGWGFDVNSVSPGHTGDLWRYNPLTNEWTWMKGFNANYQNGVYGTIGVPSSANMPGCRIQPAYWSDGSGNFYMFGGLGWPASGGGAYLNDLWRYNVSTNEWTWVNGTNIINVNSVYGTLGVPSSAVLPGGRYTTASWIDANKDLWVFGGRGLSAASNSINGELNDLFKYNIASNQWTWMKGSTNTYALGIYGTMGVPAASNMPGAREYNTFWTDHTGNLWLFGGQGKDSTNANQNHMNDLWGFTIPCNPDSIIASPSLTFCSGSTASLNAYNTYSANVLWYNSPTSNISIGSGNLFATAPLNAISSASVYNFYAESNSCTLTPRAMISLTVNPLPALTISSSPSVCSGSPITATVTGASTYTWNTNAHTATTVASPTQQGYAFTVLGTSTNGCEGSTTQTIQVVPLPVLLFNSTKPYICNKNDASTITVTGANSYSWHQGPTSSSIVVTPSLTITYTVVGTDLSGCKTTATITQNVVNCNGINEYVNEVVVTVYPNPSKTEFTIKLNVVTKNTSLVILNELGQRVYSQELDQPESTMTPNLKPGAYFYQVMESERPISIGKLLVED